MRAPYLFPEGARFGADNLFLHAKARRHQVSDFAGPLSIKTVLSGAVAWKVGGHDLVVEPDHDIFPIAKLQGGYTRYLQPRRAWTPGVGAMVSLGIVPRSLETMYGGRVNAGVGVYLTLRPAAQEK